MKPGDAAHELETAFDAEPLTLAILGMRDALERHHWAVQTALLDPTEEDQRTPGFPRWGFDEYLARIRLAATTAVEFLNWTCAMDELFAGPDRRDPQLSDQQQDYRRRRSDDPRGPVLLGMRWVRDRHMHHVAVTTSAGPGFQIGFGADGSPSIWAEVFWRKADEIGDATDGRQNGETYRTRRAAYVAALEGRPTETAMRDALGCVTAEVMQMGVGLPPWP